MDELKYLDVIKDETTRYIMSSIFNNENPKTKEELAQELGISTRMVAARLRKARTLINNKMEEIKEQKFQEYISNCYDSDGYLSLKKIAKEHAIQSSDLNEAFRDYVDSLTGEEISIAHQFGFSFEAEKLGNIEILKKRVRGFSETLNDESYNDYYKKQDVQFLESVKYIYKQYQQKNGLEKK